MALDAAVVADILAKYPARECAMLPLLWLAQKEHGYLPPEALAEVAEYTGRSVTAVKSVASFYTMLHLEPVGEHLIEVCTNISCSLLGAERLVAHLERRLGIRCGETTADGKFTLREVECLGLCDMAPAMLINNERFGNLTPAKIDELLAERGLEG
ncbi:MAG: NADH-quinone oxidoreductase subunit NuoE [Armatimonadota bacterium]